MLQSANTLSQITQEKLMVDGYGLWMVKRKYTLYPVLKSFAILGFGYPWT